MKFVLTPGKLKYKDFSVLLEQDTFLELDKNCHEKIHAAEKIIANTLDQNKTVYGINTGFGALAHTRIPTNQLFTLQESLILSHATGTGEMFQDEIVKLTLALKINSLARGCSGVRLETINLLIKFFNAKMYPCIPCQGSVGASGDLAPLAHLSAPLLGIGKVRFQDKIISAEEALVILNVKPLKLAPKEGLALINGTQVSTAVALIAFLEIENIFLTTIIAGALSVDAARGSDTPFDSRIQTIRNHQGQIQVAKMLRDLLHGSQIRHSHLACQKVQDPYSLRCQPQVMGACLAQLFNARETLINEANAVSDNPLIFIEENEILSGGNFHAEPVAITADILAICIAEIAALSERRIALLIDPRFSDLPAFLVKDAGLNSGFMCAQVTAAALASENKSLAHPASIDSLPTSANQEDHVSMATYAARRLLLMLENASGIIGIEMLAACQGIDFLRPLQSSAQLEKVHNLIRSQIPFYEQDRYFAPDILSIKNLIKSKSIQKQTTLNNLFH